jgi:hypothetical protein
MAAAQTASANAVGIVRILIPYLLRGQTWPHLFGQHQASAIGACQIVRRERHYPTPDAPLNAYRANRKLSLAKRALQYAMEQSD